MAIVAASEGAQIRDSVRGLLSRLGDVRELRVLDVGGGLNPWLGDLVTDVLDIDARKGVVLHSGDINLASTWVNLGSKEFDFVNCTHTLEDIRDPGFVISQMNRVAKSGFVSVPNRHQENSPVESRNYLGYGHHRWIFHLRQKSILEASAKFPATSSRQFGPEDFADFIFRGRSTRLARFLAQRQPDTWIDHKLVPPEHELGVLWENDLPFEYLNDDYAGRNINEMLSNINAFLEEPFEGIDWSEKSIEAFGQRLTA